MILLIQASLEKNNSYKTTKTNIKVRSNTTKNKFLKWLIKPKNTLKLVIFFK